MPGSLRDLKRRIKSVKNTQQITKAMKMVAAAKLRRAQEAVSEARPYAARIQELVRGLSVSEVAKSNPFFEAREEKKVLVLVFSADKGLCGGFNANLIRRVGAFINEKRQSGIEVHLAAVGRKAHEHFRKRGVPVAFGEDGLITKFTFEQSAQVAERAAQLFLDGEFDAVYSIFMEYRSAISQKPLVSQLLPFTPQDAEEPKDYLYEPNAALVLRDLLPRAVRALVYQAMLETSAGEHGSRMAAMESATKNAKDLIKNLTLQYNRKRQAAITTEIIEIISGANAL